MIRTIDLVAPPLVCANGRRPWEAPNGGRKRRRRETDAEGKDEGADEAHDNKVELSESTGAAGAEKVRSTAMDAWEMQMFQMLVLQGLTQSTRHKGVPSLPPALACQLCQMSYGTLHCYSCLIFLASFPLSLPLDNRSHDSCTLDLTRVCLTDELIDFFGCYPHLSKIQSAFICSEGTSPLSHAWTLEHLEVSLTSLSAAFTPGRPPLPLPAASHAPCS